MDLSFPTAIGFHTLNMFAGGKPGSYSTAAYAHPQDSGTNSSSSGCYFSANYYNAGYQHGLMNMNLRPNKNPHDYAPSM